MYALPSGKGSDRLKRYMREFRLKKGSCLLVVWAFSFTGLLYAQQTDSLMRQRELSEVEVFGSARPSVTRSAAPLQILGKDAIERLGVQDLSEAVKRFSGVMVKDYGGIGGLKTVSVRSLGAQHTAVSYDGVSITDIQSGQVDISRFTLDNVETVSFTIGQADEIFRTARMYASAGALSIRTTVPVFENKPYNFRVKLGGGSFGLFTPSIQYEQKISKRFSTSLRTDWLSAKGEYPFTLTNGALVTEERRRNSDIQSLRLEGNLYGDLGESGGELKGKLYYYNSERGLPGSVVLYNDYAKERLWDENFFAQLHYKKSFGEEFTFQSSAKYNYSYNKYRDINDKYVGNVQEDRNTQQEYYASAGILYAPLEYISASLTSDIAHNSLTNNFTDAAMPRRFTSLSVLALQYSDSRLTATASLLATQMTDRVKSGSRPADRNRLSPAVSLSWRPFDESSLRVRASFQDIFRTPTFTDMYYLRMGNTSLLPERATQYNLGLTWSGATGRLRYATFSVDAYYNKVEDKIVALPKMYIWSFLNMGEVEIKGVDANLNTEVELTKKTAVLLNASYSYQHAIDVTDAKKKNYKHQLPYTPRHSGAAAVTLENPWVNVTYGLTAVSDRYSFPQNTAENRIAGYIEQHVSLNKTITVNKCAIRLQAEVINIGDKTYDIIKYYPMPGRSWRLGISLTI